VGSPKAAMTDERVARRTAAVERPMRADARRNVELLLAAARDAFAEHGPNASLDDIARQAGVGPGTLYRHFPNRLALLEAAYRDVVDNLCAEGESLLEAEPPGEALVGWLRRFVGYVAVKHGLAAALSREVGKDSAVFAESRTRVHAIGGALLARAKDAGAIRPDADLADVFQLVSAIAQAGEQSPEGAALSDRLLDLAMDGLRSEASPSHQRQS
jgi:AcrR family transcriptional regulator